ncbi:MAG: hypothetical protein HQK93_10035, partial [Nitrospirae bacterium]|nr:hypothetical protein [Nitrospirota bacterium]
MNSFFEAAKGTPDPKSVLNILKDFFENNQSIAQNLTPEQCHALAMLFAYSRFLSRYCINNPQDFLDGFNNIMIPINDDLNNITPNIFDSQSDIKPIIRNLKKKILLKITLRFILKITDIIESMEELSILADKLIDLTFNHIKTQLEINFGKPYNDSVTIISLGKLGARELNFSSDIDLICVYKDDQGYTTGTINSNGKRVNIISNHEFYNKVVEDLAKTLSSNTEDGFVYRVDLRLRPQGQKGQLALALSGYELYYESWGREWERLALIRTRYAAGNFDLFEDFISTIKPFVYMNSINEIRNLKNMIDKTFSDLDIKKGRGGIREIEFFVQTFQLIYGGQDKLLREKNLLKALYMLAQKNLIGWSDHDILNKNYIYLRQLEQFIQMYNDLQTHKLPTDTELLLALAKKMGYNNIKSFKDDLQIRRNTVRGIYDSLFTPSKEVNNTTKIFNNELTLEVLSNYIINKNIKITNNILYSTKKIKESLNSFQSLKGKRLKDHILPTFTELALGSLNPEVALQNLLNFSDILLINESYLDLFTERNDLSKALIDVFSQSNYLSKILVENPRYIDMLSGGAPIKKTFIRQKTELLENLIEKSSISETINIFKKMEELRLGIMFLNKKLTVIDLIKGLSKTADAILHVLYLTICPNSDLIIAGFGKLGGREITINSDLDITFISNSEPSNDTTNTAPQNTVNSPIFGILIT